MARIVTSKSAIVMLPLPSESNSSKASRISCARALASGPPQNTSLARLPPPLVPHDWAPSAKALPSWGCNKLFRTMNQGVSHLALILAQKHGRANGFLLLRAPSTERLRGRRGMTAAKSAANGCWQERGAGGLLRADSIPAAACEKVTSTAEGSAAHHADNPTGEDKTDGEQTAPRAAPQETPAGKTAAIAARKMLSVTTPSALHKGAQYVA